MAVMIRALRRGEGERPAAGQAGLEVLVLTSARVHRNYSSVQTHWPQSKRSSCQAVAARHVAGLPSEICTISSLCTTHTNIECRPGQSCWGVEGRSICKKKNKKRWVGGYFIAAASFVEMWIFRCSVIWIRFFFLQGHNSIQKGFWIQKIIFLFVLEILFNSWLKNKTFI